MCFYRCGFRYAGFWGWMICMCDTLSECTKHPLRTPFHVHTLICVQRMSRWHFVMRARHVSVFDFWFGNAWCLEKAKLKVSVDRRCSGGSCTVCTDIVYYSTLVAGTIGSGKAENVGKCRTLSVRGAFLVRLWWHGSCPRLGGLRNSISVGIVNIRAGPDGSSSNGLFRQTNYNQIEGYLIFRSKQMLSIVSLIRHLGMWLTDISFERLSCFVWIWKFHIKYMALDRWPIYPSFLFPESLKKSAHGVSSLIDMCPCLGDIFRVQITDRIPEQSKLIFKIGIHFYHPVHKSSNGHSLTCSSIQNLR